MNYVGVCVCVYVRFVRMVSNECGSFITLNVILMNQPNSAAPLVTTWREDQEWNVRKQSGIERLSESARSPMMTQFLLVVGQIALTHSPNTIFSMNSVNLVYEPDSSSISPPPFRSPISFP